MKKKITQWEIPSYIEDNWEEVSTEMLAEVFSQSEKFLSELVKTGESVTSKAFKILQLSVLVLSVSLTYMFMEESEPIILLAAKISSGLSFLSILFLAIPLWAYNTYVIGSSPSKLLAHSGIIKAKDQLKALIFSEIQNYESRIRYNKSKNFDRTILVNMAMVLLILVPFSLFAAWLFVGSINF